LRADIVCRLYHSAVLLDFRTTEQRAEKGYLYLTRGDKNVKPSIKICHRPQLRTNYRRHNYSEDYVCKQI